MIEQNYESKSVIERVRESNKIDDKPNPPMPKDYGELKIINHQKYIVVNGALYELIDYNVLMIADGYGGAK